MMEDHQEVLRFSLPLVPVPPQNPWFRKSRFKGGKGKRMNIGGGGLGYRERPGLGSESSVSRLFLVPVLVGSCSVMC